MRDVPITVASFPTQVHVLSISFFGHYITSIPLQKGPTFFNLIGLKILNTLNLDGHFVLMPIFLGSRPNWIFKFPLKFFWGHRRWKLHQHSVLTCKTCQELKISFITMSPWVCTEKCHPWLAHMCLLSVTLPKHWIIHSSFKYSFFDFISVVSVYAYLALWELNPSRQNYVRRKAVYVKLTRKFKKR